MARQRGLRVIGTAGIIVRAKTAGIVSEVGPVSEALRASGFHISSQLVDEALRLAGEN